MVACSMFSVDATESRNHVTIEIRMMKTNTLNGAINY